MPRVGSSRNNMRGFVSSHFGKLALGLHSYAILSNLHLHFGDTGVDQLTEGYRREAELLRAREVQKIRDQPCKQACFIEYGIEGHALLSGGRSV